MIIIIFQFISMGISQLYVWQSLGDVDVGLLFDRSDGQ